MTAWPTLKQRLGCCIAVAIGLGIVAASFGASAQSQKHVNFFSWADYVNPEVLAAFTRETGIQVRYDTFDSNDILESKLLLGNSGYDVVMPTAYFVQRLIKAGVLENLDKTKIPNIVHAWPEINERLAAYDPGNAYAVNYMWGTTGIGYNVVQARKILGSEAQISTWDTVFRSDQIAKFRQCGVEMVDSVDDILTAALSYLGYDPNTTELRRLESAAALVRKIRPSVRRFNSSGYANALASGEICLVVGWSGDIKQAQKAVADTGRASEIGYTIPDGRAQVWFDNLAIVKGTPNLAEAYAFIDFLQRPEMAAKNSNVVRNANGNKASQQFIDPEILNDPTIYPPPGVMTSLYTVNAREPQMQRLLQRMWLRLKTGH